MRACVQALQQFPQFSASLDADAGELVYKKYVHIGFAADTPNGLVVPVVRDADRKDVFELARDLAELSEKARAGKLSRRRDAGRLLHDLEPGRHRRHGLHADHQRARGRDPRRVALGVQARSTRTAASCRG